MLDLLVRNHSIYWSHMNGFFGDQKYVVYMVLTAIHMELLPVQHPECQRVTIPFPMAGQLLQWISTIEQST